MAQDDIMVLNGREISTLLEGRELEVVDVIRQAYECHHIGQTRLPHSVFIRFPDHEKNRIIALPAWIGGGFRVAGIKWISSFPDNITRGLDRASAIIVLNSVSTGRPEVILEGSFISAWRTAASAALAAKLLLGNRKAETISFVGCGRINFEIARFLRKVCPTFEKIQIFDLDSHRALRFANKLLETSTVQDCVIVSKPEVIANCSLVSFATTAVVPHILDLSVCRQGSVLLHVSLRDLAPEAIALCDNFVDDVDHVLRAQTSLHLAEQLLGHRDFIKGTLSEVILETAKPDPSRVTVFNPFGLGILDLAAAAFTHEVALRAGLGSWIKSFFPVSWANPDA